MKILFVLFLVFALLLSLGACGGGTANPDEEGTKGTTQTSAPETTEASQAPDAQPTTDAAQQELPEGTINYFLLSIIDEAGDYKALTAYEDGMGGITVEYQGEIRKVATMELAVMDQIAAALGASGLATLNGANVYEDGAASASMYVAYADGSYLGAGYSGTIPQAFFDGYDAVDAFFRTLLADVPEYVPRPVIVGDVNAQVLAELEAILDASGMEPLDMFSISDVPRDEYFGFTMGLSDDTGILSGTACDPMMSTTPYSCVIAVLEDESYAEAVRKDFASNINWNRWVCVSADSALIAQKGNMVVCLVGSSELYGMTAAAITANGWTVLEELTRN